MSQEMEIVIRDGRVKVFEGPSRRVFYTTEEALGLSLLKLNPSANTGSAELRWVDMLGTRGLAIASSGSRLVCLQTFPSHQRTIPFRRGDVSRDYTVTVPDVLMATNFKDGSLQKASLWTVKTGFMSKLSATSMDPTLAYWPYGNVYNHGGICWGTTPIRDIHSPQDAFEAFFNSGFNGDLFAYTSTGLLNFLDGVKKDNGGVYPLLTADRHTQNCAAVAQSIVRL